MKAVANRIIIISALAVILTGCQKDYIIAEGQKALFIYNYVNHAWGYNNYGYIIDNEGNIRTFSQPEKWNFADTEKLLTTAQMEENLSYCTLSDKKIPAQELKKYVNLIDNLASSKVSAPVHKGADMGSTEFFCFRYSGDNSAYEAITIKIEGDYECENLNFYSKRVTDWMKDIAASLPQ